MEQNRISPADEKFLINLYRSSKDRLVLDRVPWKVKRDFKRFASEEYANDYGMALKGLWDYYVNLLPPPDSQIKSVMQEFNERLDAVEARFEQPGEEKTIVLGSGDRIETKR